MSVYLNRSPYFLTSYRAGGARVGGPRPAARKRRARREGSRLWDTGSGYVFSVQRPRRRPKLAVLGFLGKHAKQGVKKTGEMAARSAQGFSEVAHAVTNVKSRKLRFEIGPNTVVGGLICVSVLLGLGYLAHFNQVATKGYELRRLEADRQQLIGQYEIKNMHLAELRSLNFIVQSEKANAMRRPSSVEFVRGANVIAAR